MTGEDLFSAAAEQQLASRAPLASRLRPTSLDEVVGQEHLVGPGGPLRVLLGEGRLTSGILWGPPGTGKTTLARLLAKGSSQYFAPLSAVTAGVKDVRQVVDDAARRLGEHQQGTILFVDEVHRFSKSQQDALLPAVEDGVVVLLGATTENPFFEVNAPLLSRATLWRLLPLDHRALEQLVHRGAALEQVEVPGAVAEALIELAEGDARAMLTTLEVACALARARHGGPGAAVTMAEVEASRSGVLVHRSQDSHYDQVSAMIKSIRGSDPDAGLYWLCRLLLAGEDPKFLARRLMILASEDIGMADPTSLLIADAAFSAVERVGLPEAKLNLAHAVIHLALAPKSNSATMALLRAEEAARTAGLAVPPALRDSHYQGAAALGHGTGYRYPHDDPSGYVEQQYLPDALVGERFYAPSPHGHEPARAKWRSERSGTGPGRTGPQEADR